MKIYFFPKLAAYRILWLNISFAKVLFLTASGCNKKTDSNQVEPQPEYFITADIGDIPFKHIDMKGVMANSNDDSYITFFLGVYPSQYEVLTLATEGAVAGKLGEYKIQFATYNKSRYKKYVSGEFVAGRKKTNGKCVITKIDDFVVEGTFYFDVYGD